MGAGGRVGRIHRTCDASAPRSGRSDRVSKSMPLLYYLFQIRGSFCKAPYEHVHFALTLFRRAKLIVEASPPCHVPDGAQNCSFREFPYGHAARALIFFINFAHFVSSKKLIIHNRSRRTCFLFFVFFLQKKQIISRLQKYLE